MNKVKKMVFQMIEQYGSCWNYKNKLKDITVGQAIEIYLYAGQQLSNEIVNK